MTRVLAHLLVLVAIVTSVLPDVSVAASDVNINIGLGFPSILPPVVITSPPQLVVVPGTPVYYAPALSFNYFFLAGQYYMFAKGQWFVAPAYNGPWVILGVGRVPPPFLGVAVQYYKIPPGHLKAPGPPPWAGHGKGPKPWKDK